MLYQTDFIGSKAHHSRVKVDGGGRGDLTMVDAEPLRVVRDGDESSDARSVLVYHKFALMKFETAVIANGSLTRASLQLDPSEGREPAAVLEAFTRNELDDDQLISTLISCCHADFNKGRQALSLLDQYHRRGLLETGVFLAAKTELSLVAFISEPTFLAGAADPPSAMTALDQFSSGMFDADPR